jgi:hypothetical protein
MEHKAMLRGFEKDSSKAEVHMEGGIYAVRIPFEDNPVCSLDELGMDRLDNNEQSWD